MLKDQHHVKDLSRTYNVPEEEIILIALNACGLRSSLKYPRVRFKYHSRGHEDDPIFLILPFGNTASPFEHQGNSIFFDNEPIGEMVVLENDDVVQAYPRNGGRSLTLNSNARSNCTGCAFCYNILEEVSDPRLHDMSDLNRFFGFFCADMGWQDLSEVEKITVSTGCFKQEDRALLHMKEILLAAREHGFAGALHILSSVIRSRSGFEFIAEHLLPFQVTLTIECFTDRDVILKRSKADYSLEEMLCTLSDAEATGVTADFCYIAGLDPLSEATENIAKVAQHVSAFPKFQVFQAHNSYMESFRAEGANQLEYYLTLRKFLEQIFADKGLRPESWENYRPLWYFTYDGKPHKSARI